MSLGSRRCGCWRRRKRSGVVTRTVITGAAFSSGRRRHTRCRRDWSSDVCSSDLDVTLESLGRTIGMVLQEPFLFSGTIEENIRYASGATHDEVVAAAKAVRAHDFIIRLPKGYDTDLGQRGRNISLGQ